MASSEIFVRLLGVPSISAGRELFGPESTMLFSALLRLCLDENRSIERRVLAECLWPDAPSTAAQRQSLRQLLYRARQLGVDLESTADCVSIDPSCVLIDTRRLMARGLVDAPIDVLDRLCSGVLQGFAPSWSRKLSQWVEEVRELEHSAIRRELSAALSALEGLPYWARIESTSRALLRLDPHNVQGTIALSAALRHRGDHAASDALLAEMAVDFPDVADQSQFRQQVKRWISTSPSLNQSDGSVPLHGRVRELASISGMLRQTAAKSGSVCYVHGSAGVGKTRIVQESIGMAERLGMRVVRSAVEPSGFLRPLGLWASIARAAVKLPGALGASREALDVCRAVADDGKDPDARQVAVAVGDVLSAVADERAVLLTIDDVERASEALWPSIITLVDTVRSARVAVLIAGRENPAQIGSVAGALMVGLSSLDEDATCSLIADLAQKRRISLTDDLRSRCVAITGGLPLFAEEIVDLLAGEGSSSGRARTLAETIRRRIQLLPQDAQELLPAVAALDGHGSLARLERLTGWAPIRIVRALDLLERQHFLITTNGMQRPRHELVTETTLESLSAGARSALHQAVSTVLLSEAGTPPSPDLLVASAHHLIKAGAHDDAAGLAAMVAGNVHQDGMSDIFARVLEIAGATREREKGQQALRQLVALAATSANSPQGLKAIACLAVRPSDPAGVHEVVRALGASSIEILRRTLPDWEPLVPIAVAAVSDETLQPAERLEAAASAMILAAHVADEKLMRSLASLAQRLGLPAAANLDAHWRFWVIFHTHCGDLDEAISAAESLVRATAGDHGSGRYSRALTYLGRVHRIAGNGALAHATHTEAYTAALSSHLASRALGAAIEGVLTSMQFVSRSDLQTWIDRAQAVNSSGCDADFAATLMSLRTRAALLFDIGDAPTGDQGLKTNPWSRERQLRPRALLLAGALHYLVATGAHVPQSWVDQLSRDVGTLASQGDADWPVVSLKMAYDAIGAKEKATALIDSYCAVRRDRSPLAPHLSLAPVSGFKFPKRRSGHA